MGYFADAQYDALFLLVFASVAKQTPGRVVFRKVYALSPRSWDISLTLNMTRKEKTGYFAALNMTRKEKTGYFAYAQYDVREWRQQELRFTLIA